MTSLVDYKRVADNTRNEQPPLHLELFSMRIGVTHAFGIAFLAGFVTTVAVIIA